MFVRAYLRASTAEQDANRARARLDAFAGEGSPGRVRQRHRRRGSAVACSGIAPDGVFGNVGDAMIMGAGVFDLVYVGVVLGNIVILAAFWRMVL